MKRHLTTANALISRFGARARGGMPIALDIGAAMLLSEGAKLIYQPAGWITAGLAVLAINWRIHSDQ